MALEKLNVSGARHCFSLHAWKVNSNKSLNGFLDCVEAIVNTILSSYSEIGFGAKLTAFFTLFG